MTIQPNTPEERPVADMTVEQALNDLEGAAKHLRNGCFVASATAHDVEKAAATIRAELDGLRRDAGRWRHARKLLTIDDIEGRRARSIRSAAWCPRKNALAPTPPSTPPRESAMSREFEIEITEGMVVAWNRVYYGKDFLGDIKTDVKYTGEAILAALAHPDFRAQLRAWAAEEMRGLVPSVEKPVTHGGTEECKADAFNACRAETLANIERWEQSHD